MEESERIDECKNAKEVWDTLRVHHEGTSHVKETRIDIGVRKFEVFEMSENETIDEMYARFTTIVNEMRSLGKAYSTHERIRKILRCLPSMWRPMVTAITQAKDLKSMNLEDLIGSLRAHEVVLQGDKPVKKVKSLALKELMKPYFTHQFRVVCDHDFLCMIAPSRPTRWEAFLLLPPRAIRISTDFLLPIAITPLLGSSIKEFRF